MAPVCTFELARASDAAAIATTSSWLIESGLVPTWTIHRVSWHIRDRDSVVLVAREHRGLAGFAIMQFGEISAHLSLLGVLPSRQRNGIGRQLLGWLERSAVTAGTFLIQLEVRETNRTARDFYAALGYREVGRIANYYQGRDSAVQMSRDLKESCGAV
jgi:ribosomal protein S18 acetylase RimI-like enzyme